MAESRYNRLDNQSPIQTKLDNTDLQVPRSVFDFSTIHSGNALFGALIPVDCFDVVPNEDISISMSNLIEFRNPTTRQLLNGCRVYFHAYYNRLTDLWEGAKNFLDTGRSGNISLSRPNLIYHSTRAGDGDMVRAINACTPMSLLNYLGLPAEAIQLDSNGSISSPLFQFRPAIFVGDGTESILTFTKLSNSVDFFPADCAFAYQRNWRDFYSNKNLLQNNKSWFPDNEDHFILSYSCENAVCLSYEDEDFNGNKKLIIENLLGFSSEGDFLPTDYFARTFEPNNPSTTSDTEDSELPNLSGLKFRQFRGDRFSTALPFPELVRGDIPVIEFNKDTVSQLFHGNLSDTYLSDNPVTARLTTSFSVNGSTDVDTYTSEDSDTGFIYSSASSFTGGDEDLYVRIPVSQLTMNAIRELETLTVFKERMARTSGDYNDMIEAQYGYNPKVHERKGTYIGGFYQDFAFSSVTQLSQTTDTSPLGQKAGQGVSSGAGTICNSFHTPDFGWIQIYMSIVPDVFYTQGKPRMFDKKVQTDMYFPIFNNLAPQYIKNKELFVSGNEDLDNNAFAFEDRYSEYKSRPNRVSGFMSLTPDVAAFDSARIMARRFTSTPALNNNFVSMIPENMDMSVFSVVDEPPFDFSCGISVRRVSPMPYTAVPGSMSSNLHA